MISKKFGRKPKAGNNEGRSTKVTSIMVSRELKESLSEFKDAYGAFYENTVTFDQMLRRWMDNVKRFDPQVVSFLEDMRERRRKEMEKTAVGLGLTVEQLNANLDSFDPTVGEIWEMRYFFEKDGEEIPAVPTADPARPFVAFVNEDTLSYAEMAADGYVLLNEAGAEIADEYVVRVSGILLEHGYSWTGEPEDA